MNEIGLDLGLCELMKAYIYVRISNMQYYGNETDYIIVKRNKIRCFGAAYQGEQ